MLDPKNGQRRSASAEESTTALQEAVATLPGGTGTIEDILKRCGAAIAYCRAYSSAGGYSAMVAATRVIDTSIPVLTALLQTPQYRQAAALLSEIYQIKQGNAYHLATTAQSLLYAQEAVRYARLSEDAEELVVALHELASVYEWPLPGLPRHIRYKKALAHIEEAVYIQEAHRQVVPSQILAWNYIGQAKFQALHGLKQEVYTSIGQAHEARQDGTEFAGIYFNTANLTRQAAIAYSYLDEQPKAVSTFLRTLDINDAQVKPALPMPNRFHVSLLSEIAYSSLRLSATKLDRDLSIILWKATLAQARALHSTTYANEARSLLQTMETLWPGDAQVGDLRDLFVSR